MKCPKCGNEITGKFCQMCGTPAPTNPVCPNCGQEIKGKFCTKCGTPAPAADSTSAVQMPAPEAVSSEIAEQTQTAEPMQYPEPVQYNPAPDVNVQPQDNAYSQQSQPAQTSFGQQFTNGGGNGYTGQQFTNQPDTAPADKKSKGNGKTAVLVLSIVCVLLVIICVVIGVVACNIINSGKELVNDVSDSAGGINSQSSKYDVFDDTEPETEEETTYWALEDETTSDDYEETYGELDSVSHCYYKPTDGGVKITGYDNVFDYDSKKLTLTVPSKIDGKDVVEIEELAVFNISSYDEKYIKIIIPGSVKVIREYALAFCEDIDEVVIEDGVETIEEYAFLDCDDLKSVTVPKSVKTMTDCGIGFDSNDDGEEEKIDDFVLYGVKGSKAEAYAKENSLKFKEK